MLVMFAVDCVVSRIVGCLFFFFFKLAFRWFIVLLRYKVTVNVWFILRWPKMLELTFFQEFSCRTLLFSQLLFGHVLQMWQCDFTHDHKQMVNTKRGSRCPRVSPHHCFMAGMKFLQGDKSVVIYCKKNYLLYKDTTCLCSLSAAF